MKKVLYIITKSNFGGAQRYVYDLATNLPRADFEPVVALGGTGVKGADTGLLQPMLEAAGVRTIVIEHFMRDMSLAEDVRAFFELVRIIRRESPNVLHVTSSKAGGLGALAGRIAGVRNIVFTSHGLTFDEHWRPAWQRTLIWLFTWATILLSTYTIQISHDTYVRAAALPLCRRKVRLVWNGISAPTFLSRDDARKRLLPNAPDDVYKSPWIGSIAEYHPNKNLSVLIEALEALHARGLHAHLVLIGEGEERALLTEHARSRGLAAYVHLTGFVRDAANYLKALTVFALPSSKEGLPYVLLEAGYAALPSVVSPIPGNTDIVEDGVSGIVVHDGAYAEAFAPLLTEPSRAEMLGKAGYERVLKHFSISTMVRQTLQVYGASADDVGARDAS